MDHRIPNEKRYIIEEFCRDRGIPQEDTDILVLYGMDLAYTLYPGSRRVLEELKEAKDMIVELRRRNESLEAQLNMEKASIESDIEQGVMAP